MTDAVAPVQQADDRGCARAEGPRRHIGRTFGRDERATALTADRMILMGSDQGLDQRQLPHILGLERAGIVAMHGQIIAAGRTGGRIVVAGGGDLLGLGLGSVVAWMPGLPTGCAPAWNAGRPGWCRGRVRRRWFGRVLRMLVEARFEIGHARGQLHQLLLLEGHHGEGCQQELLHRQWRGGPLFQRNPRRWRACVHSSSMPAISMAVKSAHI